MIFLPEAADFIASSSTESLSLTSSLSSSLFLKGIAETACQESMWVSVGVHESSPNDPKHIYNTHVVIDQEGALSQAYHKIHLFDVDIENGPRLVESDTTIKGETIGSPVQTPVGCLGQQTCYDVRFAEQAIALRKRGAEILAYPSAFTVKTGMAHWGKCKDSTSSDSY
jgi:predicted amidohydrolase